MRSTLLLAQSAQMKTQFLIDELNFLKDSLMAGKDRQELIDIVSNSLFYLENMKKDLNLVEKNIKKVKQMKVSE